MHPELMILSPKCKKLNDIYFYNTINLRIFNSPIYILEIPRPARANHAAPGQIGEHGPPVPLDSHADDHMHQRLFFNCNQRGNR
jgi:hypothetical protein